MTKPFQHIDDGEQIRLQLTAISNEGPHNGAVHLRAVQQGKAVGIVIPRTRLRDLITFLEEHADDSVESGGGRVWP